MRPSRALHGGQDRRAAWVPWRHGSRPQAWLRAALICAAAATTGTLAAQPATASPAPSPAAASLASAAFMEGHWLGSVDGALSEEIWTAPAGDGMLGMWRLVADGQTRVLELLALTTDPEHGLVLRLRHFDRALVARESAERPLVLRVHRATAGEVSFEGQGPDGPLRLAYRRDGADGLVAVLERGERRDEFRYRRRVP